MENVKFGGLSKKIKEIEVDGEMLKIKPKRRHVEIFATLAGEQFTENDAKRITDLMIEMIKEANPESEIEDIEAYVVEHYGTLFLKLAPIFRFASEKELKEAIEKSKASGKKI